MTAVLAYEMMTRGKDATGVCTVDAKGRVKVRKKNEPADVFLAGRKGIGESAVTAIIHTRHATQGHPSVNANNHPIVSGPIVGIHNGVLYNDDHLFRHFPGWERTAEVDSEAIFAAIRYLGHQRAAEHLDGSWAVAWIDQDVDARRLYLARGESSPMYYMLTVNGSVIFASTEKAIVEACQYGGIVIDDPKKYIVAAKEGFIAWTDPDDGGLTVGDELRPGVTAPGKRQWTSNRRGIYYGGWDDDMEDWQRGFGAKSTTSTTSTTASLSTLPATSGPLVPYQRYQITGDPNNVKVGDRRKYMTAGGDVHTEVCIAVEPTLSWSLLVGATSTESETAGKAPALPTPDSAPAVDAGAGDDDAYDPDAYSPMHVAQPGDYISIDKSLMMFDDVVVDGGVMVGQVLSVNEDGTMTVDFRRTRLDRWSTDYTVMYRPGKPDMHTPQDDDVALFSI